MTTVDTMRDNQPDTAGIDQLRRLWTGFWRSQVLFAAVEVGVFDLLGGQARTAEQVAAELGLHQTTTLSMLEVLVGERLLVRRRDSGMVVYANSGVADAHLRRGAEADLSALMRLARSRQYDQWAQLTDILRTGGSVGPNAQSRRTVITELAEADDEELRELGRSIGNVFRPLFDRFLDVVDLTGVDTLLDVGGSTGLFSILAASRHPHLRCVSFDNPAMVPHAEQRVTEHSLTSRITVVGGDFFDSLPTCSFAHMSNVLHDWVGENRRALLHNVFRALVPGGRLAVVGPLLGADPFGGSHLLALNIQLEMGGNVPTLDELVESGRAAGFTTWTRSRLDSVSSAVIFTKPVSGSGED
jgi:SAM-dependent methyltransferase